MHRSWSEALLDTRRSAFGRHTCGAVPGYTGHVPGLRLNEAAIGSVTFCRSLDQSQKLRSQKLVNGQAIVSHEDTLRRSRPDPPPRAPEYDKRGHTYLAAGDTKHSRIPVSGEEKAHHHSTLGLASLAYDNLGGAGQLKGYGSTVKGIPGFTGFVPGKAAENVFAEGWSKTRDRSLETHFLARSAAPKKWNLLTDGGTMTAAVKADAQPEMRLFNPSYQAERGWSNCDFTGKSVDPAGRLAPKGRQEDFGHRAPDNDLTDLRMHRYQGWIPGQHGENVVGERWGQTAKVAAELMKKNQIRITQR